MSWDKVSRVAVWVGSLTLAVALPRPVLADESILDAIPADAPAVLIVSDLSQLSRKLSMVNESFGLGLPTLADSLEQFKSSIGAREGFNDAGALGIVMSELPDDMSGAFHPTTQPASVDPPSTPEGETLVLLLVPVIDHSVFIANYGATSDESVSQLALPTGHVAYAKSIPPAPGNGVSEYTLLGRDRQSVEAYEPGKASAALLEGAGQLGRNCMEKSDVTLILNIQAMQPLLDTSLDRAKSKLGQPSGGGIPGGAGGASIVEAQGTIAKSLLQDASFVIVGMDVSESGIGLMTTAQFELNSHMAKIATGKSNTADVLSALPEQGYIWASAVDMNGIDVGAFADDLLDKLPEDAGAPALELMRTWLSMVKQVKSIATINPTPQNLMMSSGFPSIRLLAVDNPKSYAREVQQLIESFDQMEIPHPANEESESPRGSGIQSGPTANAQPPRMVATYSPSILAIDGVEVDQYELNIPPAAMTQYGQAAAIFSMLGLTKLTGYVAATDTHLIMTSTTDAQLVRQAMKAVKEGNGLGTAGPIADIRTEAGLSNAMMEGYLGTYGISQTALNFMSVFGWGQTRIRIPPDLPPVAMGIIVEAQGMAFRLYVPMQVLQFGKEVFAQFSGQSQQGQRRQRGVPRGRGGPGPPPAPF